jgi:predicted nucleotide-binding protein
MLGKILAADYNVPDQRVAECVRIILANGRFADLVRDISGSPHVLMDTEPAEPTESEERSESSDAEELTDERESDKVERGEQASKFSAADEAVTSRPRPIFIGHGKNKEPLKKLQTLLSSFQIPYKVTIDEANLGRPIPQKVKDTMEECGSAILIFTADEKYFDADGKEIWRPSENVGHELGAASFAYGDRIVIFKEKGLKFPTNFQSIGYIEFEVDSIEAKTADLLKELIGFGLVRVTPT